MAPTWAIPNQHQHYDVPHFLIGGVNGKLKGGRHIHFERKTLQLEISW